VNGDDEQREWHPGHNPWAIALTVTLATFMEVLDTSIANVALPHIAGNLSVDQIASTWVLTSYLVSNAIVLPISGWMSVKLGRKRFYMSCVALFGISSFLCGIAPNLGTLIFFRILQGAGGGGLGPSEQSILADTFAPAKRGMAFAVYGMAVVLAPAIGPTLGGLITDHYSWRWIFFINVPVAAVSLLLSQRMVRDPPYLARERTRRKGIDGVGLSLIALSLGTLQIVLDKGQQEDWFSSSFITTLVVLCAVSFVATVVWEWKHPSPVIDLRLLKNRTFATANIMMLFLAAVLFGSTVLLPQFLQLLLGYTAELSGMVLSPGGLAIMLMMPLVGFLVSRIDVRYMIGFGFVASAASLFYMAGHLSLEVDFRTAVWLRIYQSIGLAFLFIPINTVSYVGVPSEKNNDVSGFINLSRNVGGSIGIAFIATLIARLSQKTQSALVSHLDVTQSHVSASLQRIAGYLGRLGVWGDPGMVSYAQVYRELVRQAQALAYIHTLQILAYAAAGMLPLVLLLRKRPRGAPAAVH
jgi:DHA2 family multidrug resistance protein